MVFVAIGVGFTGCIHPLFHAHEARLSGLGVRRLTVLQMFQDFSKGGEVVFSNVWDGVLGWFRLSLPRPNFQTFWEPLGKTILKETRKV